MSKKIVGRSKVNTTFNINRKILCCESLSKKKKKIMFGKIKKCIKFDRKKTDNLKKKTVKYENIINISMNLRSESLNRSNRLTEI